MNARGLFSLAGLVVCCGGRVTTDEAALVPIPEDQFIRSWTSAHCATIAPCCQLAGYKGVSTSCTDAWKAVITADVNAALGAKATYDGVAAAKCVLSLDALAQSCPTGKQYIWTKKDGCDRVYRHGTLPTGATCSVSWECAANAGELSRCESGVSPDGQQTSACLAYRYDEGGLGATCSYEKVPNETPFLHSCAGRLNCTSNRCISLPARGDACSGIAGDDCDIGSVCQGPPAKCVLPTPLGGKCASPSECESYECRNGRCAPTAILFNEKTCE